MTRPLLLAVVASVLVLGIPPVCADEPGVLRQRVQDLEDQVRALQERLGGEKGTDRAPPNAASTAGDVPDEAARAKRSDVTGPLSPLPSRQPGEWLTAPPVPFDVGSPRRVKVERLDATNQPYLTPEEAALVREHVARSAAILVLIGVEGLAAGDAVPDDVDLRPFPAEVVARVPRLRERAFVAAADTVAIVDPDSRRVGQVLRSP